MFRSFKFTAYFCALSLFVLSCAKQQEPSVKSQLVADSTPLVAKSAQTKVKEKHDKEIISPVVSPAKKIISPITLGGNKPAEKTATQMVEAAENIESNKLAIRQMLKPFQVLVGTWRGITNKAHGGDKVIDSTQWAWDLLTDPKHPALVMSSKENPHVHTARLTYLPEQENFQLIMVEGQGQRIFMGNFSKPVEDVPGDNDKLQRTYKLEMTEEASATSKELFRFVFNQQENNRYLLEIYRKKGAGVFVRIDTVATQREGTSFALSDSDYGEKTCIISQGLGTIQVSYQGKSFWVCCTGCKAAFEEDPVRWITLWEQKKKGL